MARDILVSIIGDDVFARDWMSLLLVRDWRTRVISEITSRDDFESFRHDGFQKVDFYLIDVDSLSNTPQFLENVFTLASSTPQTKLIFVSQQTDLSILKYITQDRFAGYLLKDEILSSLAWAITYASEGSLVLTPSTLKFFQSQNITLPANKMILRSRSIPGLTERQTDIARLAIIFSIGRRDLADELKISDQWSYGMVSELYYKLGLTTLFDGTFDAYRYMENDDVIKDHINEILADLQPSKKARDVETLAFHLLTMPLIEF